MHESLRAPDEQRDETTRHPIANVGAQVFDVTGNRVGTVIAQHIEDAYVVIRRGIFFPREIYVPLDAIATGNAQEVRLRFSRETMLYLDWTSPPVTDDLVDKTALDVAAE